MYCDFEELARLLTGSETQYTVGARVADYTVYEGQHRGDDLKRELRTDLREAGVVAPYVSVWEDESRTLLEAVNTERTLIQLIVSFIILLTGGVIFILVYQLVNEKVKDIGILKALGYSPWGIRSVFMFNALFIGLFGALIGGLAGMFTSQYLNQVEDFIDQTTGYRLFPPEVYYLTYIPSIKGWELVMLGMNIVVPVVLFSFLCGIYPALLAAKKDPVEALHYE
jgi:lipoprotein-releasing system permease protein